MTQAEVGYCKMRVRQAKDQKEQINILCDEFPNTKRSEIMSVVAEEMTRCNGTPRVKERPVPHEEWMEWVRLHNEGVTNSEIGRRFNRNPTLVCRYLRDKKDAV